MRESISESILSTINDLHRDGLVDENTKKYINTLCEPEIQRNVSEPTTCLKKTLNPIQLAIAELFDATPSSIKILGAKF